MWFARKWQPKFNISCNLELPYWFYISVLIFFIILVDRLDFSITFKILKQSVKHHEWEIGQLQDINIWAVR
jgi:hypothetical protein